MPGDRETPDRPVTLVPAPPDVFERWRASTTIEYAAEKVTAGAWQEAEAVQLAEEAFRELLPRGMDTPGHEVWSIRRADDTHVGILWVGPRQPSAPGALYIWDISIDPEWRGRGLGRATLDALEAWARGAGYDRIGLHVFGWNQVARRLYERAGYVETDVNMEKRL